MDKEEINEEELKKVAERFAEATRRTLEGLPFLIQGCEHGENKALKEVIGIIIDKLLDKLIEQSKGD